MSRAHASRAKSPPDAHLLEGLRWLLVKHGKLTASRVEASPLTWSPNVYIRRFGSLTAAYARVGYEPNLRQRAAALPFKGPRRADRGA